jgi:predicted AAA+ superfamily ATPase
MANLKRRYERVIRDHFRQNRQMLLLMGPRQVGKTTTGRETATAFAEHLYLNWDNQEHRRLVLSGPDKVAERMQLDRLREEPPLLVLDEVHRYGRWKGFLKGLFDSYPEALRILVTGSARMDVFKAGGDSLMGRYFPYRMHPLSVAEISNPGLPEAPICSEPRRVDEAAFEALLRFGGFPEPFVRSEQRFYNRWRRLRSQQLFREDLRDLTRIQEIGVVESLAEVVRRRSGQLISLTSLAQAVNASVDSARRWLRTLEKLYYCFAVRPWSRNIARALRKEPKYYLWDWSLVEDPGQRTENLVASALLKAVHMWTDLGFGEFGLYFIRDKQKREVDFVVTREDSPWFLVEVKSSGGAALSPQLGYFQGQTGAAHAFQVALDLPFLERDCFEVAGPVVVPARTFLAQLV